MHEHGHAGAHEPGPIPGGTAGARHRRALAIAFALTAAYMLVEFAVGLATGSLAMLADAAHMGADVFGLGMALVAIWLAARPRRGRRTFGFARLEVLAALANGALLFVVAGAVIVEAIRRWSAPPEVPGWPLIITAVIGLAINLVSMRLLMAGQRESLNVRGAYLEVLADMLGSLGVIASAIITLATGWAYADPIMGIAIGLFILPRTWNLVRHALRILLEVAPPRIDVAAVERSLAETDGVREVHDLHVWTVTSGIDAAAGHLVLEPGTDQTAVLERTTTLLREHYEIGHTTMQCESAEFGTGDHGGCS
ncbi:MAG: cation diffusion facilitator family transporter [Pseudoclavibacter sp.]